MGRDGPPWRGAATVGNYFVKSAGELFSQSLPAASAFKVLLKRRR